MTTKTTRAQEVLVELYCCLGVVSWTGKASVSLGLYWNCELTRYSLLLEDR